VCAGFEGEGAAEEALLVELRAIVVAALFLLDEIDGSGGDEQWSRVGGEGES
jgi:hypothetical protein